jgi:hypothetical protein
MGVVATLLALTMASSAAPPLGVASLAPDNVDAVIQMRGGLEAAGGPGGHMLRSAVARLLRSAGADVAWHEAAAASGMKPEALLDRCAGRDASLVIRLDGTRVEWVLAMEIAPSEACQLLKGVGARVTGSGRFEIPRLGLVGSRHGPWVLVTDDPASTLHRDMHRVGCDGAMPSLRSVLPQDMAAGDDAAVMVALRHACAGGGRSIWAIAPSATGLRVRMEGRFASDPLERVMDGPEPMVMLEVLPEETLVSWMQPLPVQPLPAALVPLAREGQVPEDVRRTLGDRMAVLVGPGTPDGISVAVAYEIRDPKSATEAQDAMLMAMARQAGSMTSSMGLARSARGLESPRDLTGTGLAPRLLKGVEAACAVELHARTVCMKDGGWRVYANDRGWLDRVVGSLEEHPAPATCPAGPPQWTRSGFMQGEPLGQALQAWAEHRARQGQCGEGLLVMAEWARLVDVVAWRVAHPEPGRIRGELEFSSAVGTTFETESTVASRP